MHEQENIRDGRKRKKIKIKMKNKNKNSLLLILQWYWIFKIQCLNFSHKVFKIRFQSMTIYFENISILRIFYLKCTMLRYGFNHKWTNPFCPQLSRKEM